MNQQLTGKVQARLEAIVAEYEAICRKSAHSDFSDLERNEHERVVAMSRSAVSSIAGENSQHMQHIKHALANTKVFDGSKTHDVVGVVQALLFDVKNGHLESISQLIHGELFDDFLEMASHLLAEGYKDPAAVVAGSTLESHLRQLAQAHSVPVTTVTPTGGVRPKKADAINAELVKVGAYTVLDQKSVLSWLDLRNNAAHGKYAGYDASQVRLMIAGIRDFMARHPA